MIITDMEAYLTKLFREKNPNWDLLSSSQNVCFTFRLDHQHSPSETLVTEADINTEIMAALKYWTIFNGYIIKLRVTKQMSESNDCYIYYIT